MTDTYVDPRVAGAVLPAAALGEQPADRTIKAEVLSELASEVSKPFIELAVPGRPGWTVDFDVSLNADLMKHWGKLATDDKTRELDTFELSMLVIAGQCRGIRRNGELIQDGPGPLNFTSPLIVETYGSADVRLTVRRFYGDDGAVAMVFARIQEEAAAGSLDPTTGSSD